MISREDITSPGPLAVTIRRNADGVVRTLTMDLPWRGNDYWWSEGNASCDCNRPNWFREAGGEDHLEGHGICPGSGAYDIVSITIPDGTVVYGEDP